MNIKCFLGLHNWYDKPEIDFAKDMSFIEIKKTCNNCRLRKVIYWRGGMPEKLTIVDKQWHNFKHGKTPSH